MLKDQRRNPESGTDQRPDRDFSGFFYETRGLRLILLRGYCLIIRIFRTYERHFP